MTLQSAPEPWAALAARLGPDALAALALQGFVSAEPRPSGRTSYKLRWRQGGRQRVRYLGSDAATAERVRAGLAALQAPRDNRRELARLLAGAAAGLARARDGLAAAVGGHGFHFHGYTLRQARQAGPDRPTGTTPNEENDNGRSE